MADHPNGEYIAHETTPVVHSDVHHEETDINVRAVMVGTAIFVVFSILMLIGLWGMFVLFREVDRRLDPESVTALDDEIPNEVSLLQGEDLEVPEFTLHWSAGVEKYEEFKELQEIELNTWGWIDESSGRIRMPIDEAMEMALSSGFDVRTTNVSGTEVHPPWMTHASHSDGDESIDETFVSNVPDQPTDEISLDQGEPQADDEGLQR